METSTAGWIGLIIFLFVSTFGIFWMVLFIISLLVFLIGIFSFLYLKMGNIEKFYAKCTINPLTSSCQNKGGLKNVTNLLSSPKRVQKTDSRVTGSDLIDKSLQDILGYIVRDYVQPWYSLLSTDNEFTEVTIRHTTQTFAINVSNRIKDIDWIPYLTQRLVDDAATHLRLYRQARTKMKAQEKVEASSSKDLKVSPKRSGHKRNKSETDVTWYLGRSNEIKKGTGNVDSDSQTVSRVGSVLDLEKTVANSKFYTEPAKKYTLEEHFFDLECQMEKSLICRDIVCMEKTVEKEFLCEIVEVLLYILLPDEDFQCKPLRYIVRDILSNGVLLPIFDLLSDPDYINQVIIWISLRNDPLQSEVFLTTLRLSEHLEELKSCKELVLNEIHNLRSRDTGGDSDLSIKQQLSSLTYVNKLIDSKLTKLENSSPGDSENSLDYIPIEEVKNIDLSLEEILRNNLGLSYFMDFALTQDRQLELFFYLNIEGWRNSISKELSELKKSKSSPETTQTIYDSIRSTALDVFEQYLGNNKRVLVNPDIVQNLHFKIRNLQEVPSEFWFDRIQETLLDKMRNEVLPAFKKSKVYVKLLHELDLIQQNVAEDDTLSTNSTDSGESKNIEAKNRQQTQSKMDLLSVENSAKIVKHARSFSDVTCSPNDPMNVNFNPNISVKMEKMEDNLDGIVSETETVDQESLTVGEYALTANIIETGIVCEKGKTFGIYAIRVCRQYETGFLEEWHIYRRYSDFYDLHTKVKDKYLSLSKIAFPGKKTFHNMDRAVLERRMKMLGHYLNQLSQPSVLSSHSGLKELLMSFLEQGDYDRVTGGPISSTINTLVNPIKSSMKTIKNVPEQLISTVDDVVEGISKVFHSKSGKLPEASKVGASIEETDDNIPLRIMLLLMDEVFDLKSRNQWLRRRIVTLLRQIVRAMFGDIVNRRILDYVSYVTSPKNVAHYLHIFKQSFWPNGIRNDKKLDRAPETKSRTRIAAKAALLSSLSDELKHIIGSETTRRGLLTIFELFQRPTLNRRLLYVTLEGMLSTLFPEKDMVTLFQKLHSKSKRTAASVQTR